MRIIPVELEISKVAPFKNCLFERQKFAQNLTNILQNVEHPMTLAVTSDWGNGKTTFLNMWNQHLKNEGFTTIRYDAFVNDRTDDPFLSLFALIIGELEGKENVDQSKIEEIRSRVWKFSKSTAPAFGKAVASALSGSILSGTFLDEFTKAMGDITERSIKEYQNSENTRLAFQNALSELAAIEANDEGKRRPLVILVDELDRCRPPFALNLLEVVKHFFEIDNLVFVFFANKAQLQSSVGATYGCSLSDSQTYLGKFFTLEMPLPAGKKREIENNRKKFIKHLIHQFGFRNNDFKVLNSGLNNILVGSDVSLRTIEKVIASLALLIASDYEIVFERPHLTAILLAMRTLDSDSFYKARHGTLGETELIAFANKAGERGLPTAYLKACVSGKALTGLDVEQVTQFFRSVHLIDPEDDFQELTAIIEKL